MYAERENAAETKTVFACELAVNSPIRQLGYLQFGVILFEEFWEATSLPRVVACCRNLSPSLIFACLFAIEIEARIGCGEFWPLVRFFPCNLYCALFADLVPEFDGPFTVILSRCSLSFCLSFIGTAFFCRIVIHHFIINFSAHHKPAATLASGTDFNFRLWCVYHYIPLMISQPSRATLCLLNWLLCKRIPSVWIAYDRCQDGSASWSSGGTNSGVLCPQATSSARS